LSEGQLKLKNNPDSTDLSEAVKEYDIPARHEIDGVKVPLSPVVVVDPIGGGLVPQGWYLYQARRVNTSGGAGALHTRITMNPGQAARLVRSIAIGAASAGATLEIVTLDEDGAGSGYLALIGAGASRTARLPSVGIAATATNNIMNSQDMMFGPGETIDYVSSASLITETLTVGIVLLLSTPDIPIWDITGSVGGSALADSTISAANTLQKVDLPW